MPPGGPPVRRGKRRIVLAVVAAAILVAAGITAFGLVGSGSGPSGPAPGVGKAETFSVPNSSGGSVMYSVTVAPVVRDGPFARLDLSIGCYEVAGCDGGSQFDGNTAESGSLGGVWMIDPAHQQVYQPVEDSQQRPETSTLPSTIPAGVQQPAWVTYPALPSSTHDVAIAFFGGGPTVLNVPVTTPSTPWQPSAPASPFVRPANSRDTGGYRLLRFPVSTTASPARPAGATTPSPATFDRQTGSNPRSSYHVAVGSLRRDGPLAALDVSVTCAGSDSSSGCAAGSDFTSGSHDEIDDFSVQTATTSWSPATAGGVALVGDVPSNLSVGATASTWLFYAAPPSGSSTVTVVIPGGPALGGVPVR